MTVRFLHTGDWQLGMTRRFLDADAQARFGAARFDAIRRLGRVADERGCAFIAVCGDVFETNQVEVRTVHRALEALSDVHVPVFLLPGNHDPLDPASIFDSATFAEHCPSHVHVIRDTTPIAVAPGVEVVGLPWTSKRPGEDLVGAWVRGLEPTTRGVRVLLAHGPVDTVVKVQKHPATIGLAPLEAAIRDGRLHFAALGDRHAPLDVGQTGRVWYAGAPEPTDYDESPQGCALVVDVDESHVAVETLAIGEWSFERAEFQLARAEDVERLGTWLEGRSPKSRAIVRLDLGGRLDLVGDAALTRTLDRARDAFAALDVHADDLVAAPETTDIEALGLGGFARVAATTLQAEATATSDEAEVARDALALLMQLAERGA